MNRKIIHISALLTCSILSCVSSRHPWHNLPDSVYLTEYTYLDWFEIDSQYRQDYIDKLKDVEYLELTRDQIDLLLPNQKVEISERYFIVRALRCIDGGTFKVMMITKDNDIYVKHYALASKLDKAMPYAIIVKSEVVFNHVYVSYSYAR